MNGAIAYSQRVKVSKRFYLKGNTKYLYTQNE